MKIRLSDVVSVYIKKLKMRCIDWILLGIYHN